MKKSYTLFIIFILFCVYSCNNNYTVGPVNPHYNVYDTVLFQQMDSFNIYLNGVYDTITPIIDTVIYKDTTFFLALQGQKEIVLTYTGTTNHPDAVITDSSSDVKISIGDSVSTMIPPDTNTVYYEHIDSTHLSGFKHLDTYRHTTLVFAQCHIRLTLNHNHRYGDGDYFIKLNNLRFYEVVEH